jgi:hypothetical protein
MGKNPIQQAITRLASLYEYGQLEASMSPANFLNNVADEVESLRKGEEAPTKYDGEMTNLDVARAYVENAQAYGKSGDNKQTS